MAEPTSLRHDVPVTLDAYDWSARAARYPDATAAGTLRWIGSPLPGRLFAAIFPAAYRRLPAGQVPVLTTVGGDVDVVVRSNGHVTAKAHARLPAGGGEVSLGRPLPQGDYAVELTVTNGAQIVRHRLGVTTRRTLPLREAITAIRRAVDGDAEGDGGGGVIYTAEACRRAAPRRVVCDYWQLEYGDAGSAERCAGKVSAHLRADGLRILRTIARRPACRRR